MYRLIAVILLGLSLSVSTVDAATHGTEAVAHGAVSSADETNKNMAMVGGGLLGILLASGAVGLISASTMVLEGAAIGEALEAGAGLPMSLAVLSAILGSLLTQEFVLEQITAFQKHRASIPAAQATH